MMANNSSDARNDLARLKRLEQRLRVLEHAEAIRNLKARYAGPCDNNHDADDIATLLAGEHLVRGRLGPDSLRLTRQSGHRLTGVPGP
jgi:hypothetical protein